MRSRRDDGVSYVEMLIALAIAALLFAPAYRFAASILKISSESTASFEDTEAALDVLARDLRCATTDSRPVPFHMHAGRMAFTRSSPRGPERVDYDWGAMESGGELTRNGTPLCAAAGTWQFRFFDGEIWRDEWGWNEQQDRPSEGITGLPLAVDVSVRRRDGALIRRVVPVMTSVINRWAK